MAKIYTTFIKSNELQEYEYSLELVKDEYPIRIFKDAKGLFVYTWTDFAIAILCGMNEALHNELVHFCIDDDFHYSNLVKGCYEKIEKAKEIIMQNKLDSKYYYHCANYMEDTLLCKNQCDYCRDLYSKLEPRTSDAPF